MLKFIKLRLAKPYPNTYEATSKRVQREDKANARPAIKGKLPNVKKYDTVFVGSPVWWGQYPMIMHTFFEKEPALNGKTLISFSTSGGSGLADLPETLRKQFPKSRVLKGFTVEGEQAKGSRRQVNNWLAKLGYQKKMALLSFGDLSVFFI